MRIAFFSEVFAPKIDGVVTRLTRSLDQLAAMGHEAIVVAPRPAVSHYAGFPVLAAPSIPFPGYPEVRVGRLTPRLSRQVRAFSPDLIHTLAPTAIGAFGVCLARRHNIPLVASFHTDLEKYVKAMGIGFLAGFARYWINRQHATARINLVTSPQMMEYAAHLGIERLELWPKAVDTATFRPQAKSTEMRVRLTEGEPHRPLAIYVGRVSKEKSLTDLVPLMSLVPSLRLAVVGGGPELDRARELFAGTDTLFTGYLTGDELAAAYASADVCLNPSTTETLGLTALEAAACGVPVVAANAGGLPHVVNDGVTGRLVAPHDAEEFAIAVRSILADPGSMGREGRIFAERHDWATATTALVSAYERALDPDMTQGSDATAAA